MNRFFGFLYPERTHLKAVIAALVAVFLLSGVLAYQVYSSERQRKTDQEAQLRNHSMAALETLTNSLQSGGMGQLQGVFVPALSAILRTNDRAQGRAAIDLRKLCPDCTAVVQGGTVYDLDYGSAAPSDPLAVEVAAAPREWLTGTWTVGMYVSSVSGQPQTVAFALDTVGGFGWAAVVSAAYADTVITRVTHNAQLISNKLIEPITNDSAARTIFRIDARVAGRPMLSSTTTMPSSLAATDVQGASIFPGTVWTAAVLPQGRSVLLPRESFWLAPNLMLLLMALIAGVIVMAINVVRREEELHRLRADLISGVSHELRTPLAQIRMFAETLLLGRTRTEAERRRSLEVIDQEAKRLSHFVENMLQFAKGEGGRTRIAPELSSFAVEIRRAAESFAPMCQARGVEVRTELEDGVTAPVDRAALRRIMLNLMENALKYGPDEQRITVGSALFNDVVRVWVDDEGEGIPRLDRERVFDSFYRLNRELDKRVTGSGIGLAVVRQLATLHGGRAWAEEAPGGGARLVVEFPDAYVRAPEESTGWAVA